MEKVEQLSSLPETESFGEAKVSEVLSEVQRMYEFCSVYLRDNNSIGEDKIRDFCAAYNSILETVNKISQTSLPAGYPFWQRHPAYLVDFQGLMYNFNNFLHVTQGEASIEVAVSESTDALSKLCQSIIVQLPTGNYALSPNYYNGK